MTPTVLTELDAPTKTANILQRCVCLQLRCGYVGNSRKVNLDSVDVEKDGKKLEDEKSEMGATKRLFSAVDLRPCQSAIGAIKQQLQSMSVDGGTRMLGAGAYLIPKGGVTEAVAAIKAAQAKLAENAEKLVERLPELLEARKAKLGPLFVQSEYPTPDDIRADYKIAFSFVQFGAPDMLMEIDGATAEEAREDWNVKLAEAYDEVVIGLRASAMTVMQELVDRLKPGEDGKTKGLRPTALRDLQDLLGRLPILNSVGDDVKLPDVLAPVGALVQGLDVETLKKAPAIRGMLLEKAEQAVAQLDGLISSGRRGIILPPAKEVA